MGFPMVFPMKSPFFGGFSPIQTSNPVGIPVVEDGTCRGVVDTGTSHLSVPGPYDKDAGTSHPEEVRL